ncbi:MAG: transporter substrate-binding domain-containing protein [Ruminococcaceae bacterium]|nr:transporter substrate-binding domain-containing protein [Oscillospiraceae bacterium]
MKKIIALALALATICCFFTACGGNADEDKTLTMATNATFPPYEFYEGEKIVGIDAEIAAKIAEKLGMELEIQDTEFGSIIAGVQTGKYDIGMAGMTVTEERLKTVNFSTTYATGVQAIIVPEGSAIKTVDDITPEHKIGVQQDTTGHIYASDSVENGGYGEDAVVPFNKGTDAVAALVSGKVDCVIIDNEPAKAYVAANDGLVILDTEYVTEDYAICVAKDNEELLEKINTALEGLIADGTVEEIVNKYISAE